VTALLAADVDFHEFSPTTFPMRPEMKDNFEGMGAARREELAPLQRRPASRLPDPRGALGGIGRRSYGGFDTEAASNEFFPEVATGRFWPSHRISQRKCWFPRLPRLEPSQVVSWS